MTMDDEIAPPRTGLCWYGLQRLPPLLDAFSVEIAGVKEGKDIEYIHRMRVASRRLRAALPLFRACFPEKQYKKWMEEISGITRALGDARDADVQIAFLEKSIKKTEKDPVHGKRLLGANPSPQPGLQFLLAAMRKRRGLLQKHVLSSVESLEKSGITGEMHEVFASMDRAYRADRKRPPVAGLLPVSALRINRRLFALLAFEPWIYQPDAVAEHHAMRIAAKKLRYTMEIFGPVYRNNLKKPIGRVKRVQEILGEIHDCDVWIDQITGLLLRERSLLRSTKGTKRPDTLILSSLRELLHSRERERKRLYRRFIMYWQVLGRAGVWHDLQTFLASGGKAGFRPPASYRETEAAGIVHALSMICPEMESHSRHVTDLALMLFDDLLPLHALGSHDRFLLSCAGSIHDIGWKFGEHGHNRRGAEMFFSDSSLPFTVEERAIIAFIIRSHRGRVRVAGNPYYGLITAARQRNALMLASLLRVADGLDLSHTGSVRKTRCAITKDSIACTVSGSGNNTREKEHAQEKSDLFFRVFKKALVIP